MIERVLLPMGLALLMSGLVGCATRAVEEEPLPAHPFPRWVGQLEAGKTDILEVLDQFGDPDEIEESVRGGVTWRYSYEEIHWPADDPDRPSVAAEGEDPPEEEPSTMAQVWEGIRVAARYMDRLVYYPGTQPRPPRLRRLPARIHSLELFFAPDGSLRRYRYTPYEGSALVPEHG